MLQMTTNSSGLWHLDSGDRTWVARLTAQEYSCFSLGFTLCYFQSSWSSSSKGVCFQLLWTGCNIVRLSVPASLGVVYKTFPQGLSYFPQGLSVSDVKIGSLQGIICKHYLYQRIIFLSAASHTFCYFVLDYLVSVRSQHFSVVLPCTRSLGSWSTYCHQFLHLVQILPTCLQSSWKFSPLLWIAPVSGSTLSFFPDSP